MTSPMFVETSPMFVVNQADKVAPGVIKAATNDINNIAKQRID